MPHTQPAFLSSLLSKSMLHSLASVYLVRIYIGTALILPILASSAMANPSAQPNPASTAAKATIALTVSNPRIDMLT